VLLVSALWLAWQLGRGAAPWIAAKVVALIAYIVLGSIALKRGRTPGIRAAAFFAALATPLVFSVHTIVSFDFATSVIPGWHATIFPPYFVIGAIFSGFAMVITLMTFMRGYFGMKNYITLNHMENMAKIIMLTGMLVGFAYLVLAFTYARQRRLVSAWRWTPVVADDSDATSAGYDQTVVRGDPDYAARVRASR